MSWNALLQADAANIFADEAMMPGVEQVTLKNANGDEEVITVPVWRDMAEQIAGASQIEAPRVRVFLPRTEQRQVIDKDALKISLSWNIGEDAEDHHVAAIEKQDAAGWLLRLR